MFRILKTYISNIDKFNIGFIVFCILVTFWGAQNLRFLHGWDDQWAVLNNYTEDGYTSENIWAIFTNFYGGQYAPINQLYYTLLYYFFGYNPMYYHIASVGIHIANASLVYHLLKKIANRLSGQFSLKNLRLALITSVLFAVSPFNLEPVAWVSAAKVILYALFYICALHSYCSYLEKRKLKYYYLTVLFFAASFGGKEQAVTLPLCLSLLDYVYQRNFKDSVLWYEKIPFLILSILFGFVSIQSQGMELFEAAHFYSPFQRVVLSFYTVSEYLTKTVLPLNISYLYPFPFQIGDHIPTYLYVYPVTGVLTAFAFFQLLRYNRWLVFGMLFFLIHVILVSNLISLARFSIVADRYAYLSTIGIYFVMAYLIVYRLPNLKWKRLAMSTFVVYILYFSLYTNTHLKVWSNAVTVKEQLKNTIRARSDYKKWKETQTKND